ncbi:unnamed protein product [Cuscuta epithymum]|uniref:Uncharacterized protein n=1 Tax=Cuscuta epithymum TaxID=186058 RepID=A0AAV0FB43_9ASTE|nr:unnamed protein product [Cuscuta epithymum]
MSAFVICWFTCRRSCRGRSTSTPSRLMIPAMSPSNVVPESKYNSSNNNNNIIIADIKNEGHIPINIEYFYVLTTFSCYSFVICCVLLIIKYVGLDGVMTHLSL